jgi:hypothetical protein
MNYVGISGSRSHGRPRPSDVPRITFSVEAGETPMQYGEGFSRAASPVARLVPLPARRGGLRAGGRAPAARALDVRHARRRAPRPGLDAGRAATPGRRARPSSAQSLCGPRTSRGPPQKRGRVRGRRCQRQCSRRGRRRRPERLREPALLHSGPRGAGRRGGSGWLPVQRTPRGALPTRQPSCGRHFAS